MSNPFATSSDIRPKGVSALALAPMGTRVDTIGRYKMPLLPGEKGIKSLKAGQEPWVPGGIQSMTNLASSISDSKALGDWLIQQNLVGVGLSPDIQEALRRRVYQAREAGIDFQSLKETPEGKAFRADLMSLAEKAKDVGGGNAARDAGIVRHDVWEAHGRSAGQEIIGTAQINAEIQTLGQLLTAAGFEIIPSLVERTVRNVALGAAGRFDNILMHRATGRLYMADLKTKRKPFWTFLEIDAQLAGYASSEWMLEVEAPPEEYEGLAREHVRYVEGPLHHVDQEVGVVLHMPSDGSEPRLRKADLVHGLGTMHLAREVCTRRSYGRSAARMADSWWPVG